ncbi:hypothetical protein B9Q12_03770 [Candidatus Marsarchaeota G2 archaeon ECH_B_SAG-G06]|uniref:CNNM transmembrane domain-containing protein n=1 Tax=Candidatus Marsarchaeota G2 archaeon ECH_B_SAG-G06 TaxID=1978166 RepID=A0A2R6BZ09_9ARCH|nr:MAG: hypothetical protein B9Q12_03770 [Candidatus Marsarchaeota G2 archaeon ECH_B_SAG-G06]
MFWKVYNGRFSNLCEMLSFVLHLVIYFALVAISFVFSASETAYSTLRASIIRLKAAKGDKGSQRVLLLIKDLPHTLNAIIIGDNLVNLAFTSFATYTGYVFYGALGALIFSVVNFVIVFVVGEAWPKNVAVNNPENLAIRLSGFMYHYVNAMEAPARIMTKVGRALARVAGYEGTRRDITTEERMIYALELAKLEGVITDKQHDVISRVLRFDDLIAQDIMVPLDKVVYVNCESTVSEVMQVFGSAGHRTLPVVEKDERCGVKPVGAIHVRDATVAYMNGFKEVAVKEICEDVVSVRFDEKLIEVLSKMQQTGSQIAAVNKDGCTIGFIFINDLLEEIVGEMMGGVTKSKKLVKKL